MDGARAEGILTQARPETRRNAMEKQPFRNYTIKNIPEADYKQLRVMAAWEEISINTLLLNIINKATHGPKVQRSSD